MAQRAVYTHDHSEAVLRSHSWRTAKNSAAYVLPHIQPTMRILDIGCGPGTITFDFAQLVPEGHVTGIDAAQSIVDQATAAARDRGVTNVAFATGDALHLDFPDDTFDIVHCHQVLQHVGDPVQMLREMRRVAKPGGIVAARECDFSSQSWYPESQELNVWLDKYNRVARANGGEPDAGRRLHVWAKQAGFTPEQITLSVTAWCFYTPEDKAWWSGLWADRTTGAHFATSAIQQGVYTQEELDATAEAWRKWGKEEDAWLMLPHGELIAKV